MGRGTIVMKKGDGSLKRLKSPKVRERLYPLPKIRWLASGI